VGFSAAMTVGERIWNRCSGAVSATEE
jgi:hypothetical protein